MEFSSKEKLERAEEFDKFKTKVLKYVLYKKRTESEVREKFAEANENDLEDVLSFLKQYNYLNDEEYIERSILEFKALKSLSIKEIKYKLLQKGIDKSLLENYLSIHYDELQEYEINSAKKIFEKKIKNMEVQDIKNFLYKKGYGQENINSALKD